MFWIGMLVGMALVMLVIAVVVALGVWCWRTDLGVKSMSEYENICESVVYACVNRDSTIAVVPHDVNLEVKEVLLKK